MTALPVVTLVIRLYRSTRLNEVTLTREVPMGHLPGVGEQVAVTSEEGVLLAVTKRHWTFDGHVSVYLGDIFIDPTPADTHIHADETKWLTDHEGREPIDLLLSCGWE